MDETAEEEHSFNNGEGPPEDEEGAEGVAAEGGEEGAEGGEDGKGGEGEGATEGAAEGGEGEGAAEKKGKLDDIIFKRSCHNST